MYKDASHVRILFGTWPRLVAEVISFGSSRSLENLEKDRMKTPNKVYSIDPLEDPRWIPFLEGHPDASIFHTPAWLQALHRTYGYRPLALTTTPPKEELTNGVVFCRVNS